MRRLALAVLAAVAAGLPVASAAPRDIELVSRQSSDDGGAAADSSSHATAVSADGRYVAFESTAENLSRADDRSVGYFENVFVRDMETAATVLVSRADGPRGRHDGAAGSPAVSPDGRYVAFSSFASHMSRVDRDDAVDVFVRDLRAKRTILVSPRSGTGRGAFDPAISRRGRFVAFRFQAARRGIVDCRVRDIRRRRTVVVSVSSDGAAADRDCPVDLGRWALRRVRVARHEPRAPGTSATRTGTTSRTSSFATSAPGASCWCPAPARRGRMRIHGCRRQPPTGGRWPFSRRRATSARWTSMTTATCSSLAPETESGRPPP